MVQMRVCKSGKSKSRIGCASSNARPESARKRDTMERASSLLKITFVWHWPYLLCTR